MVDHNGQALTLGEGLAAYDDPDEERRRPVLAALGDALEARADIFAACYDALVGDRLAVDALRGLDDPLLPAALQDGVSLELIETKMAELAAPLAASERFFRCKAAFRGQPLTSIDVYLPWQEEAVSYTWEQAVELAVSSLEPLSPRLSAEAERILSGGLVETAPRGQGGSCCFSASRRLPAYVAVDFDGSLESVLVLVHELGHALHGTLAFAAQPHLLAQCGPFISEVPALVSEALLFSRLESEPGLSPLALRAAQLERCIGATGRQAAIYRFERRAYAARADNQTLSVELASALAGRDGELLRSRGHA